MAQVPVYANDIVMPIDGSASAPPISIGGDGGRGSGNSGTGIYGSYGSMSLCLSGVDALGLSSSGILLGTGMSILGPSATYSSASSYQPVGPDLNVGAGVGKNIGTGTAFIAPIMGNLIGASLTKTGNYLAGVIGELSVTGVKGSTQPVGGVLGLIADGVSDADGAFVAVIDGDSAQTNANAAFKAMSQNSTAGSGFNYGLDLHGAAHDGFNALAILKADIRMSNQICILQGAGAPVNGTTGLNFAERGSLYIDRTNGKLYITTGPASATVWVVVGTQA